jgi:hypothetical protein
MKICSFTLFALASALPTIAGSFTITDIVDPNGNITNALSPFTSVTITNGFSTSDGLGWSNVGAQITTLGPTFDLGFYGEFACSTPGGCTDTFEVDYGATGFLSGTNAFVALDGFGSEGSVFLQAYGANQSLGFLASNASSSFSMTSSPILVGSPADFSGQMYVTISLEDGGNLSLPGATSANLIVTQGSGVPEPGTLGIVAACGLLLFYIRRLRKA